MSKSIRVFGRTYPLPSWIGREGPHRRPLVVVCLDGQDPSYFSAMSPSLSPLYRRKGSDRAALLGAPDAPSKARGLVDRALYSHHRGRCVMPSFTNPNNVSIVTGRPPAVHGICGNYFVDPTTGAAVPMTDPAHFFKISGKKAMGSTTFLAAFREAGLRVGCITSKDKLLRMLKGGIPDGADTALDKRFFSIESTGVPMYEAEGALAVFRRAQALQADPATRCDVLYLSTTDYMQHTYAPGEPAMAAFCDELDALIHGLHVEANCVIGVTADHGMSAKPDVAFLGDILVRSSGLFADAAAAKEAVSIVLPITDPHVVHHAALGSFAWLHLRSGAASSKSQASLQRRIMRTLAASPYKLDVLTRRQAAARFGLPPARIGDIVVSAPQNCAVGSYEAEHDLSKLKGKALRSHGGVSETDVPLIFSSCLKLSKKWASRQLHNYDIFPIILTATTH